MNCALLLLGAPLQQGRPDKCVAEEVTAQRRPARANSSLSTTCSMRVRPLPPYSAGQLAQIHPPAKSFSVHSSLKAVRASGVMVKSGSPQPSGRFSFSQRAISTRKSSASVGYARSISSRYPPRPGPGERRPLPSRAGSHRTRPGKMALAPGADQPTDAPERGDGEGGVAMSRGEPPSSTAGAGPLRAAVVPAATAHVDRACRSCREPRSWVSHGDGRRPLTPGTARAPRPRPPCRVAIRPTRTDPRGHARGGAPWPRHRRRAPQAARCLLPGRARDPERPPHQRRRRTRRILASKGVFDTIVSLAGLLGRPVRNQTGQEIGRLDDVVARWADGHCTPR